MVVDIGHVQCTMFDVSLPCFLLADSRLAAARGGYCPGFGHESVANYEFKDRSHCQPHVCFAMRSNDHTWIVNWKWVPWLVSGPAAAHAATSRPVR